MQLACRGESSIGNGAYRPPTFEARPQTAELLQDAVRGVQLAYAAQQPRDRLHGVRPS